MRMNYTYLLSLQRFRASEWKRELDNLDNGEKHCSWTFWEESTKKVKDVLIFYMHYFIFNFFYLTQVLLKSGFNDWKNRKTNYCWWYRYSRNTFGYPSRHSEREYWDNSQPSIIMNCLRIILDMFALTKANIFDPFANKIDQSQYLNIAKVGTELGKRIFTFSGQNSSSSSEATIVGSSSKKGVATISVSPNNSSRANDWNKVSTTSVVESKANAK